MRRNQSISCLDLCSWLYILLFSDGAAWGQAKHWVAPRWACAKTISQPVKTTVAYCLTIEHWPVRWCCRYAYLSQPLSKGLLCRCPCHPVFLIWECLHHCVWLSFLDHAAWWDVIWEFAVTCTKWICVAVIDESAYIILQQCASSCPCDPVCIHSIQLGTTPMSCMTST